MIILIVILLSYLVSVGLVNLTQYIINLTFSTDFNFKVWLLGLLLTIIINILFNKKSN
jgi:hypothetical protein